MVARLGWFPGWRHTCILGRRARSYAPRQAMTAEGTLRFIRHCLGLFLSLSIQGAASVSVGGALAYVAALAGVPVYYLPFALLFGMAVPQWPLRVFFSP